MRSVGLSHISLPKEDGNLWMLTRGQLQRNLGRRPGEKIGPGMLRSDRIRGRVGGVGSVNAKKICEHPVKRPVLLELMLVCMLVSLLRAVMMRPCKLLLSLTLSRAFVAESVPLPVRLCDGVACLMSLSPFVIRNV